nr:acyltransferase [uncultured Methanolobus sp.]
MTKINKIHNISKAEELFRSCLMKIAKSIFSYKLRRSIYRYLGMKIGKDSFIGSGLEVIDITLANQIILGERVTIAPSATIVVSSGPNKSKLSRIYPRKIEKVIIDDDAWIGTGSILLPGVKIGTMSIVGSGSVVTKDVQPYTIVAGVPAKIIKRIEVDSDENSF